MTAPRFRRRYADDPRLEDRVFALLETWFVGIGARRRSAARLGSTWRHCSTPFVAEQVGRLVAHVGLVEMPYVIAGERRLVGGVHGVCTLASARRQGHFRGLMEEMLGYCEGRYETLELSTEHPEYYEPFGFRVVPEHRFLVDVDRGPARGGFRPLDLSRPGELEHLDRLLTGRAPVSQVVGIVGERDVFKFCQGAEGLHYSPTLDCFAALAVEGQRLIVSDVVATALPTLEALLDEVAAPVREVELRFSPDAFGVDARPERFRYDTDYFMVRGPFAAEGERFMVPVSARH